MMGGVGIGDADGIYRVMAGRAGIDISQAIDKKTIIVSAGPLMKANNRRRWARRRQ